MEKYKLTKITAYMLQQPYSPNNFLTLWYINWKNHRKFQHATKLYSSSHKFAYIATTTKNQYGCIFFCREYGDMLVCKLFISDSPYNAKHLYMLLLGNVNLCTVQFIYIFFYHHFFIFFFFHVKYLHSYFVTCIPFCVGGKKLAI